MLQRTEQKCTPATRRANAVPPVTRRRPYEGRNEWLLSTLPTQPRPSIMDAAHSWNPAVAAGTDDDFLPPPPAIGFMPFRPENRMTTLLVCAVLLLCALAVTGVRFILVYPSANST